MFDVCKNISFIRDTDSPGGDKKRRYLVQSMGKARERFQAASGNTQVLYSGLEEKYFLKFLSVNMFW